jgi:hypothetical protein
LALWCEFNYFLARKGAEAQKKSLGGLASLRESIFFSQSRKDAKKLKKPLATCLQ